MDYRERVLKKRKLNSWLTEELAKLLKTYLEKGSEQKLFTEANDFAEVLINYASDITWEDSDSWEDSSC